MVKLLSVGGLVLFMSTSAWAEQELEDHTGMLMNHGDGHLMDMAGGMVMGQNTDVLPGGCDSISEEKEITVHAGHKYAEKFPGRMFAFDTQEFQFEPCTKLTVHFINEDNIRHQWMMHGLPKYLYAKGMFHLEVSGPAKISGTLILPPGDKTYLVHCDIAQHMEKGMKAQLKVGKGDGDLPSIPGVTANAVLDDYTGGLTEIAAELTAAAAEVKKTEEDAVVAAAAKKAGAVAAVAQEESVFSGVTVIGIALGLLAAPFLAKKFKGMSVSEAIAYSLDRLRAGIVFLVSMISGLMGRVLSKKNKLLSEKK
ncbi:Multicopper oxidase type 2 [Crenothrix polyspora]|uniref:Multicopper oxidase type 2 n=1 Tax=Crenothrix polyspora TaxID=360316 RepID=A0A1R4HII2_9GAMM|nr:copper oxidase [Crenothrix polyspora]SJM95811.1 Multicopper oxidase type 2 [Crenothrix polyspora]